MNIYTSCWYTTLPPEIQKIGVSRGTPRGYPAGYRKMMKLAPGPWFRSVSVAAYRQLYFDDIIVRLDPREIVNEIRDMSGGRDAALLCYEQPDKPDDWCHRGYISAWLKDRLDLDVFEYGMEGSGCGWAHPKIPEKYRQGDRVVEPLDVAPFVGSTTIDGAGRTWTVEGQDPENPDQAMIVCGDERASISADVLRKRFKRLGEQASLSL